MQSLGVAAFISVATFYVVLPHHLHGGAPLHLHDVLATTIASAKIHREHAKAGKFPPIYCRGNFYLSGGFIQGIAPVLQELIEKRSADSTCPGVSFGTGSSHQDLSRKSSLLYDSS